MAYPVEFSTTVKLLLAITWVLQTLFLLSFEYVYGNLNRLENQKYGMVASPAIGI